MKNFSQHFGQAQDLPLHLVDSCRSNPPMDRDSKQLVVAMLSIDFPKSTFLCRDMNLDLLYWLSTLCLTPCRGRGTVILLFLVSVYRNSLR